VGYPLGLVGGGCGGSDGYQKKEADRSTLMNKKTFALAIFISAMLLSLTTGVHVNLAKAQSPKTIVVPDDFSTIPEAIQAANDGDTIFVRSGTYYTNTSDQVIIIDKSVSLIGEDPENTIIDGVNKSQSPTGYYHTYPIYNDGINIFTSNVTVSGFTITNCETAFSLYGGIDYDTIPISGIEVVGNNITGNAQALYYVGVDEHNFSISQNNITNNDNGISFLGSNQAQNSSVVISNNTIAQNGNGAIQVFFCSMIIKENSIISNEGGITLDDTYFVSIYGNIVANNSEYGINFDGSNNATVYNNNLTSNSAGILLTNYRIGETYRFHAFGSENLVYDNNIEGNSQNILVQHVFPLNVSITSEFPNGTDIVSWDNGYVGNYWSDYQTNYPNASETDNSGILEWNTPYVIDANNTDRYPLISPS
jgi:parallel beta-helix repeat protein